MRLIIKKEKNHGLRWASLVAFSKKTIVDIFFRIFTLRSINLAVYWIPKRHPDIQSINLNSLFVLCIAQKFAFIKYLKFLIRQRNNKKFNKLTNYLHVLFGPNV